LRTGKSGAGTDALVKRIRARDEAAVAQFADLFGPKLLGFYINGGLSRADAEEAANDCLKDVISAIICRQYKRMAGARFEAFLFTIARNMRSDWLRKRSQYYPEKPFDERVQPPPEPLDPNMEIVRAIDDALILLRNEDEEIISLRHFQEYDLSFKDIANRLGIHETHARVRHHRAFRKLRGMLEADPRVQRVLNRNACRRESSRTYEHKEWE
jgi:RNA polymerase sigma-70 factor, ECF subfamily